MSINGDQTSLFVVYRLNKWQITMHCYRYQVVKSLFGVYNLTDNINNSNYQINIDVIKVNKKPK